MPEKKKIYILDTNVLIYDPYSLFSFGDANIGIPVTILEELDKFKSESSNRGFSSRQVVRSLDTLRNKGDLRTGVKLDNGGVLKVLFLPNVPYIKPPLKKDIADNQILLTALHLKKQGYKVIFISKDISARVKADVLGIKAEDYLKGRITQEEFLRGWTAEKVNSIELTKEQPKLLKKITQEKELSINEFILLQSKNNPLNYRLYRFLGGDKFKLITPPRIAWNLKPRNPQQEMAFDLLMDDNIKLTALAGPAGTGKTFLALLAGLHKILIEDTYSKLLISRPVIPLGPDIGYLPGDIQEKLHSWMQPVYDNIDYIVHEAKGKDHLKIIKEEAREKYYKHKHKKRVGLPGGLKALDKLIQEGKISLEAITYMRGRSIPYQYIIIDEVQNLNPHEVKTLISRAGEGSKIILAGDPYQIDSPYLDFSSNGLIVACSRFKGQPIFGSVFLETSERGELSKLAAELM